MREKELSLTVLIFFPNSGTLGWYDMWNASPDCPAHVDTLQNQLEERGRQCISFSLKLTLAFYF